MLSDTAQSYILPRRLGYHTSCSRSHLRQGLQLVFQCQQVAGDGFTAVRNLTLTLIGRLLRGLAIVLIGYIVTRVLHIQAWRTPTHAWAWE